MHEPIDLMVVNVSSDHKGRRCGVKNPILRLTSVLVRLVVGRQRFDQHCLGADASVDFEVVEQEWGRAGLQPIIQLIVLTEI